MKVLFRSMVLIGLLAAGHAFADNTVTLRTAAQENAPKFVQTPAGMTGLCIDLIKAIEKADPGIKFTGQEKFVPWARILELLEVGEIDAFVGIVRNPEREKKFQFIDIPVYEVSHTVAQRADDPIEVKTLDDIAKLGADGTILTNTGVAHIDYLKEHGKGQLKVDASAKDFQGNFTKLVMKRGRFFYLNDIELVSNLKNFDDRAKIKISKVSFGKFPHFVGLSKKVSPETVKRLTVALEKASKEGAFTKIFENYLK